MPRSPILIGSANEGERAIRVGLLRISVGSLLLLAPGLARRLFGLPANQDNDAVRLVARLFGVRNILLGAMAIRARSQDPEARRLVYEINAAVDAADIAVLAAGGVFGEGLLQAGIMGSALGATAELAWLDLLKDLESGDSQESVALT